MSASSSPSPEAGAPTDSTGIRVAGPDGPAGSLPTGSPAPPPVTAARGTSGVEVPTAPPGQIPEDPESLVQRAIGGETRATNELIAHIRPKILAYCRARLGRETGRYDLADDVAQNACLGVLSALPRYRDMGKPFMAFVYGITAHKVADAKRGESRTPYLTGDEFPDRADEGPGPEESALRVSEARRARQLMDKLPARQRELLLLRVAAGLSAEETGKVLGMTPGAVRIQQHRSLARLRGLVDGAGAGRG